jgi:hypothetical protein
MNQKNFNQKHNRRLLENPSAGNLKDYLEYTMTVNKDAKVERKAIVNSSPVGFAKGQHMDRTHSTFAP